MQTKFLTLCTPLTLGWVSADKSTLIELSELIGFGYDLSDAQDGLC